MGTTSSCDSCVVARLLTTKPETLALVPLSLPHVSDIEAPLFRSLYQARSEHFIQHWFGSPEEDSLATEQQDRTTSVSTIPTIETYHAEIVSKLNAGARLWSVLSFGPECEKLSALKTNYPTVESLLTCLDASTTCGFYSEQLDGKSEKKGSEGESDGADLTPAGEEEEPVPRLNVDYFITKQLCNDAKSSTVLQLIASVTGNTVPVPLTFRVRDGNIPVLRMCQKLYRSHIAFRFSGNDAGVSVEITNENSCAPKWLKITVADEAVLKGLVTRLKNSVRDARDNNGLDSLVIFAEKQPNPLPTPLDDHVDRGQLVWSAEGAALAPYSHPIETRKRRNKQLKAARERESQEASSASSLSTSNNGSAAPAPLVSGASTVSQIAPQNKQILPQSTPQIHQHNAYQQVLPSQQMSAFNPHAAHHHGGHHVYQPQHLLPAAVPQQQYGPYHQSLLPMTSANPYSLPQGMNTQQQQQGESENWDNTSEHESVHSTSSSAVPQVVQRTRGRLNSVNADSAGRAYNQQAGPYNGPTFPQQTANCMYPQQDIAPQQHYPQQYPQQQYAQQYQPNYQQQQQQQSMPAPPTQHQQLPPAVDRTIKLPMMTPVHVWENEQWRPLWWCVESAEMVPSESQPFLQDQGSLILEAAPSLMLLDENRYPVKIETCEPVMFVSVKPKAANLNI